MNMIAVEQSTAPNTTGADDAGEILLPMTNEITDQILQHLTAEVAGPIFELLKFRRKNGLTHEVLAEQFTDIVIRAQTFQHYLSRMKMELQQLFAITPPLLHRKISAHLKGIEQVLEEATERKNLMATLKAAATQGIVRNYLPDGNIELVAVPVAQPLFDVEVLSSDYFDEYRAMLKSMLFNFKEASAWFSLKKSLEQPALQPPVLEYLAPALKPFIKDWHKFLQLCYEYSRHNTAWGHRNEPIIKCLDKEKGIYLWMGPQPALGEYITMLGHIEVSLMRPNITKKELAALFLKFFGLSEKYKDPHFLSTFIEPISPPKLPLFAGMPKILRSLPKLT